MIIQEALQESDIINNIVLGVILQVLDEVNGIVEILNIKTLKGKTVKFIPLSFALSSDWEPIYEEIKGFSERRVE